MTKEELLEYAEDNQGQWMINAMALGIRDSDEHFSYIIEKIESGEVNTMEELKKFRIVS